MTSAKLRLEPLEERQLLSTCHVTRLTDQGIGKGFRGDLRYCINKVNAEPGPDAIDFNVTGTIVLNSELPDLASDVNILGPGTNLLTVERPSGAERFRIFRVTSGANVTIADLTALRGVVYTNSPTTAKGGGILNEGNLVIQRVVLDLNGAFSTSSSAAGGSIYNSGDLTLIDSTITRSYIDGFVGHGGGVANYGTMSVFGTTISENRAGFAPDDAGYGGGIYSKGVLTVFNSTIAFNNSNYFGPGLVLDGGFSLLSHSTIYGNQSGCCHDSGGIDIFAGAPVFIRNSIVAGHENGDIFGSIAASDYNLIGNSQSGSGFGPNDLLDVDPLLGPLANNGGPTLTMAFLPGSPAIDAGDNADAPEWDQRGPGFPRIVNGTIDIGAFEVQASPMPAVTLPRPGVDQLAFVLVTADMDSLI